MNKKENKISVIVAVYNIESYVEKCIKSIVDQSYKNLEIILIDDGSTDKSGLICDKYKSKDDRIIVIHQENKGLSEARNAGIKIASGKYITFVDGDDTISKIMYETMVTYLDNEDVDIAVCRPANNLNNLCTVKENLNNKYKIYSAKESIKFLFDDYVCGHYAWNKLYSKSLFNKISYPEGKYFEDIYTTYKLFMQSKNICFLDDKLFFHRERPNQITNSQRIQYKLIKDHIGSYINLYNDTKIAEYKDLIIKDMLNCLKRCKRLTIQNKVIDANKKEVLTFINENIKKYCTKQDLTKINYLQSRILLKFNHIPVLYWTSKFKQLFQQK